MARDPSRLVIFVLKRLAQLLVVLFGVIVITFYFTHVAPTNPCAIWNPHAKLNVLRACEVAYQQPLLNQFGVYFDNLLHGDWGTSVHGAPVLPTLLVAVPATLELVLAALFLMIVVGIPLGVIAANSGGRLGDHLVRIFYLSGWATPTYLGAVIAAIAIAPAVGLPSHGQYTISPPPFPQYTHFSVLDAMIALNGPYTVDAIAHLILPASVLAFINMGIATRMTRSSMLEVLPLDYVQTARMKGLSEFLVLYKHALRNALITTTTVLGVTAGGLLSGTVVVEELFAWGGIGAYAYSAITNYEFAETIGVVIVFAIGVVVANLVADILYGLLDPRVEWR
jgi:peptide/nickel transport system permease protein